MANPSLTLSYGHFGQAVYDLDSSVWAFDRSTVSSAGLRQLGNWKTLISPATTVDQGSGSSSQRNTRDTQLAAKTLSLSNPDLFPSLSSLPEQARISAAIVSTTETYNPAIGSLLTFGSFTADGRWRHVQRVAALPHGESGSMIRLVALVKEKTGWEFDKNTWLQGYSLAGGESGYWVEDGAPVLELCFAQGEDRRSFLAARYPSRTVLFRPFHTGNRKPTMRPQHYELPPSRIDANAIAHIDMQETGGAAHAHVTFNPEYQRQMGLIDRLGNWSVWDIDGGYKEGSKYKLTLTTVGTITPIEHASNMEEGTSEPLEDGWARMLWVGNVNTIFVCTRRQAAIYDIRGEKPKRLHCASLTSPRSADWILDVHRPPERNTQFLIITSTHILLMGVQCISDIPNNDTEDCGAHILLSVVHSRGLEDITLQCSITVVNEEMILLLYSRLNTLVTLYRLQHHETSPYLPHASCDPISLYIDDSLITRNPGDARIAALQLSYLKFSGRNSTEKGGPGAKYQTSNVQFYQLSAMLSDLSVHQTILYSSPASNVQNQLDIEPFAWRKIARPHLGVIAGQDLVDVEDDFIVADGLEAATEPKLARPQRRTLVPKIMTGTQQPYRPVDYQFLYEIVLNPESASSDIGATSIRPEPISDIVKRVETFIEHVELKNIPRETIMELARSGIEVPDIDQACSQLQGLLSMEKVDDSSAELQFITGRRSLNLSAADDQTPMISSLYDDMLENWIGPLPRDLPVQIRQAKERLARQIAAEVMLSSVRLRTELPQPGLVPGASQDSGVALPILPSRKPRNSFVQPEEVSSQPPPASSWSEPSASTPLDTQSPSNRTRSTRSISGLTQHLKFSRPLPTITTNVGKILTHWEFGTDPDTYDWEAMTRLDEIEDEEILEGDEELSQKEREKERQKLKQKQKRKAERLLKRQRRERDMETRRIDSLPILGREAGGMRSSPGPTVGMATSSQTQGGSHSQSQGQPFGLGAGTFGIVQSQVEPGRHGSRPVLNKKKKGKGRMSGF